VSGDGKVTDREYAVNDKTGISERRADYSIWDAAANWKDKGEPMSLILIVVILVVLLGGGGAYYGRGAGWGGAHYGGGLLGLVLIILLILWLTGNLGSRVVP
jgi:hypothetical protein